MKRSKALAPAVLLLVPALFLAGCGSDDDKPSSSSSPSSSASESPSASPSETADASGLIPLEGNGFTVSLPDKASSNETTITTPAGDVPATVYATEDDKDGGFLAALVTYPSGVTVDLDGAVKGIAKGYTGTVETNETIEVEGNPARQARVDGVIQGEDYTFYILAVDVDDKLFQLIHAVKGAAPATPPAILGEVAATLSFG